MSRYGFVGDLLIRAGVVDPSSLARAAETQASSGATLGRALAELGIADESTIASTIAGALHLEWLDEEVRDADPAVRSLLPEEFCRKHWAVPLAVEGNRLRLALVDPSNYTTLQDVEFRTGKQVMPVVVTQTWLERTLALLFPERGHSKSYDLLDRVEPVGEVESLKENEYELADPAALTKDTELPPIVRLVNLVLSDAAKARASDVHVEPGEVSVQVRQRVDGLLREVLTIPRHLHDQTISRIKIISGMDIAERRKPQDGRCRLRFEGRRIDLRVSTLPTQFGEKVVIRLLDSERAVVPLEDLGFTPHNLRTLRSWLERPQGMVLVTGPTGSGKTSTLYAALNAIKSPTTNIITLEDPIEFQVRGVNQMQVNPRAGVTFAGGLRSILRQDPDVILVGEIRDQETANVALEAAQTGHLLLSTLHTNDAPGTITRLFDLGIQPFLIASSLTGVLAQRLVRRPCGACGAAVSLSTETIDKLANRIPLPAGAQWIAGGGCAACGHTGFRSRIAIHELLEVNDEIRALIAAGATEQAIRKACRHAGMRTLAEDGIDKAASGLTTVDEVLRVVSLSAEETSAASPRTSEPAVAAAEQPGARRRVLVVEDSGTIVTVVKYFLELEGFDVVVAEDGRAGLDLALREVPDAIVSDIKMPNMNGLEMVKALRDDPRTAGVRILMLTSEESVDRETEGLAAGADDYLVKPVEPRRLAARVKALLARSRAAAS